MRLVLIFLATLGLLTIFIITKKPMPTRHQTQKTSLPTALTTTPQALFQKAVTNQSNKELAIAYYNQAIQLATQNIDNNPSSAQAWYDRGWLYATVMYSYPSLIPSAISDLRRAQQNNQTYQILANLYIAQGDLPSALAYHQLLGNNSQIESIQSLLKQAPLRPTPTFVLDTPKEQTSLPSLIVAYPNSPNPFTVDATSSTNAFSGELTLSKGQSSLVLNNQNITSTSLIYVSSLKGGKNLPLSVLSKSKNKATIGLPYPSPEDIQLQYWIISN